MGKNSELESKVAVAIREANDAPYIAARASGCGRAYVCVSGDRALIKAVKKVCEQSGLIFNAQGYGVGKNAIYMGYDNADGRALGRARVFAEVLNRHGIAAYDDAASD